MQEFTIGRGADNGIIIEDQSVSRNHASLLISGNDFTVRDNNSSNGTYINGIRVGGVSPLKRNDILKVGNALVPWMNYINTSSEKTQTVAQTEQPKAQNTIERERGLPYSSGALVCGILGVLTCFWGIFGIIGLLLSILAVVLGASATTIYKRSSIEYTDSSYRVANAGKVLGIIGMSVFVLMVLIIIIGVASGELR